MAGASVSKKLFLKSWDWLLLINPPEGHDKLFSEVELVGEDNKGEVPAALLYATNQLGTDLNRDILWQELKKKGFEGVRLVALDDTWSAMMFRRAAKA
jgi:hypothetical protein